MRLLLFADIHIGSIKDTTYIYNVTTEIIEKEVLFKKTDAVIILGDYFDRLCKVNEEYVSLAINIMSFLVKACIKNKTKIRIVYGTESHEMNQYKLFNYHITSGDVDMKIFDTVTEEELFPNVNVLYVPEEYISDKSKHYKKYLNGSKHYNYIFGHGIIEDGMPAAVSFGGPKSDEKQVPRFKSGDFSEISDITVFGHYHCFNQMKYNVYYLGSLFRDSFGEETPKGYGIIEDKTFTFVENTQAYVYKTYEFDPTSEVYKNADEILKAIDKIKEDNIAIFDGTRHGRIRLTFKTPSNLDPTFKENLKNILINDKHITSLVKESSDELLSEIKEDLDEEYDFILDPSLPIEDKIHRFITINYDDPMTLDELKSYINGSLK